MGEQGLLSQNSLDDKIVKLVYAEKPEDFIPLLQFPDNDMAFAFAQCIDKCEKYGLEKKKRFFHNAARAILGVPGKHGRGNRADLYAQASSQVFLPGSLGENTNGKTKRAEHTQNP